MVGLMHFIGTLTNVLNSMDTMQMYLPAVVSMKQKMLIGISNVSRTVWMEIFKTKKFMNLHIKHHSITKREL